MRVRVCGTLYLQSELKEILDLNAKDQKPENLQVDQDLEKIEQVQAITNDLERLDRKYSPKSNNRKKSKNKKRRRPNRNPGNNQNKT